MSDFNDIVKLAVDAYHGKIEKYSMADAQETIRKALIEANGGSTKVTPRSLRDGSSTGLFTLIEILLESTVLEGLQSSDYFNQFVDFRNVAEGDRPVFEVEDDNLFVVAEAADGTQGIRRQRLSGITETTIPTTLKAVRIYEEMNRVLSGRVDFNDMIRLVADSFSNKMLEEIYSLWIGATASEMGGAAYFPTAGSYSEDALLDVIAHVEAAAGGKTATIIGTKKALRNLKDSIVSDTAKEDVYNYGYTGKFYGSPVVAIPQRHKIGTTDFVMDDNMLTIVAGDDKPIKVRDALKQAS